MLKYFVAVMILPTPLFGGIIHDLSADWSFTSNPNGRWTYGHYTAVDVTANGSFQAYDTAVLLGTEQVQAWK